MEDNFSIFHTGSFRFPFHTKNLPFHTKIVFYIPYHTSIPAKFRAKAMRNLYCTFATLSVPLQVVTRKGRQYDIGWINFELESAHELLMDLNSTFA